MQHLLCTICFLGNITHFGLKTSLGNNHFCIAKICNANYFLEGLARVLPKDVVPQQPACSVCPQQPNLLLQEMHGPRERHVQAHELEGENRKLSRVLPLLVFITSFLI